MENTGTKNQLRLKDVVQGLKMAFMYLLSKWKLIVVMGLLGAALGLTYAWLKKPVYRSVLTFALEEKGSSMGGYASIASQFGIDLGSGLSGNGGAFVGENLLELLKSRFLIEKTLLTEVNTNGQKHLLVNDYIHFNEIDKTWENNTDLKPVIYEAGQSRAAFSLAQDSLLYKIYEGIVKKDLDVKKVDKKLNIVVVQFHSTDELFAKQFVEELVKNASAFYIETKTKKTRANVGLLENRVDSVKRELDQLMYGAAVNQDQNQNPAKAQGRVPLLKKQMDIQILTTMYGELVKNLELSKFTLMREEPLIQVIDKPILPLDKKKAGKLKWLVIGGMLGGVLTSGFLLLRRTYRKLMIIESNEAAVAS